MPAVKNVGEPCAGEPHARFDAAAGGNQTSRASMCRAVQAPLADPTTHRSCRRTGLPTPPANADAEVGVTATAPMHAVNCESPVGDETKSWDVYVVSIQRARAARSRCWTVATAAAAGRPSIHRSEQEAVLGWRSTSSMLDPDPRMMVKLGAGDLMTAHVQRSCRRCRMPLYAQQPMAVVQCTARDLRGCGQTCRPDDSCSAAMGDALHVGCAVLWNNGDRSNH